MDTRPQTDQRTYYWVVTVEERPDPVNGFPGFKRRLRFNDITEAMRAWEQAKAAGFEADADYVQE